MRRILFFALVVTSLFFLPRLASAQGTAFTYQGRLSASGSPGNGVYDFQFSLFDAETNGNQISGTLTATSVPVSGGLFTTTLDFGGGVFNGQLRWLQIGVATNGQ